MQTRRANFNDLLEMQHCNLRCLPENYNLRYYLYHYLSWPELLHVTHDYNNNVCGYVLAKLDDEEEEAKVHGHITSLAVLRTQRKLGVASKVMVQSLEQMEGMTGSHFCSLHVRRTNEAALHLYQNTLGFRCAEVDEGYYVDGEDAFHMKKYLNGKPQQGFYVNEDGSLTKLAAADAAGSSGKAAKATDNGKASSSNAPTAANNQKKDNNNNKKDSKKESNNAKDAAAKAAAEIEAESGKGSSKKGKK